MATLLALAAEMTTMGRGKQSCQMQCQREGRNGDRKIAGSRRIRRF